MQHFSPAVAADIVLDSLVAACHSLQTCLAAKADAVERHESARKSNTTAEGRKSKVLFRGSSKKENLLNARHDFGDKVHQAMQMVHLASKCNARLGLLHGRKRLQKH